MYVRSFLYDVLTLLKLLCSHVLHTKMSSSFTKDNTVFPHSACLVTAACLPPSTRATASPHKTQRTSLPRAQNSRYHRHVSAIQYLLND